MKIAVLMDSFDKLHQEIDTTLTLLRAAYQLKWTCAYFTLSDIACHGGCVYAHMQEITQFKPQALLPETKEIGLCALSEFDIILMRQDPPFNSTYLYATYLLELAEKEGVLVANKPQSVRDFNEKMSILYFPTCIPPTVVSANIKTLREFWEVHQQVIYKPLDSMGGQSVFYVGADSSNLSVILEVLTQQGRTCIMAQRYIEAIKTVGDKRILMLDGEPVPYALIRKPKEGELRGNIVAGASSSVAALTERDQYLCRELSPILREKALSLVGVDVIGDYVTEINVTSPSCVFEIQKDTGIAVAEQYLLCLEQRKRNLKN